MRSRPRAFTIVEMVMAMVIVSGLMVAVLHCIAASRMTEVRSMNQLDGLHLADELLDEVMRRDYEDPSPVANLLGLEADEALWTDRQQFDDCDDYNGYSESPPVDTSGNAMEDYNGWTRRVTVEFVTADDPDAVVTTETGVKRVTVTIEHGGRVVAELVGLRTRWSMTTDNEAEALP